MQEILTDFKLLYCRWPHPREIAPEFGVPPAEAEKIIYHIAGMQSEANRWREPTEDETLTASFQAHRRLQLASLIKHGYQVTQYVTTNWSKEELKQADRVYQRFPAFVPTIELLPHKSDPNHMICQFSWPHKSKSVIGMHYPQNRVGPHGAIEKISIPSTALRDSR
jgi:hypothetical protein